MLTLVAVMATAAAAQVVDQPLDCENAMTQQDMNQCAQLDYVDADAALNAQWKLTAADMKRMDTEWPDGFDDGRPGFFEALLAAQRAWLQYRDTHCTSEGYLFRGGSMEPFMVSTCKTHLTKLRTQELRELVEFPE